MPKQTLLVHDDSFTIHSLEPDSDIPACVLQSPLFFIGKTEEELSIVVPDSVEISSLDCDEDWRALELLGPLQLSLIGIMAQIGQVLAAAKVPIFVVSTFDTDFFLVKGNKLQDAINALKKADYSVNQEA